MVESDELTKSRFYEELTKIPGYKSLVSSGSNNSSIPNSLFESAEFIINIVNEQGVVKIGEYYYKIDYNKRMTYSLPSDKIEEYINDLLIGNQTAENKLGAFSLEADVIDLTESGYKTEPADMEPGENQKRLFCWRGSRATADNIKCALYFRDFSAPKYSTFGKCVNFFDGRPVVNSRLKVKLEYISLGIYHRLDIDGKLQRQDGAININGVPIWVTKNWGIGEGNWKLNYDIVYKGRCVSDIEKVEISQALNPPMNNVNKTRKVFWERARGLSYYCLKADASIYTNNFFSGPANNDRFCADDSSIRFANSPTIMNSTALPPFRRYILFSRTICQ